MGGRGGYKILSRHRNGMSLAGDSIHTHTHTYTHTQTHTHPPTHPPTHLTHNSLLPCTAPITATACGFLFFILVCFLTRGQALKRHVVGRRAVFFCFFNKNYGTFYRAKHCNACRWQAGRFLLFFFGTLYRAKHCNGMSLAGGLFFFTFSTFFLIFLWHLVQGQALQRHVVGRWVAQQQRVPRVRTDLRVVTDQYP